MSLPLVSFPTLGWQVVEWIEMFLCHGPGDVQAEDLAIDDEIALFIAWVYRLHPKGHALAGRRLTQRAVLSRPKGRAKSEIAGALVCAEALGPVRFDHWAKEGEVSPWGYVYSPGEPVGRAVKAPFIRCLATEEDQSGNTYDNVVVMLSEGRIGVELGLRMGKEVGITRTFLPDGGEITPSTASSAAKDGGKETFAVADETHLYVANQLRSMYRTVARNTGKRKEGEPWMLDTTTAWQPGERSIAEQAAEKYANEDVEETLAKSGVLYDHRQAPEPKRFGDDRSLIKAMREGYGPAAEWMDFHRIVRLIRDAEDPEGEAYRYWLNRPRAAASHWLSPDEIQAVLTDRGLEPKQSVALGFDGSENDDHTALVACTEDGLLIPVGLWTPAEEDTGWHTDVDEAVRWTFQTFEVVRFYLDPPYWQEEVGKWAVEFSDSRRKGTLPVAEFWTNAEKQMAVATGALRTAIRHGEAEVNPTPLRTEAQKRDGKDLFVWHFENARVRKVQLKLDDKAEEAYIVRKERPGSQLKIDGVTSSILARRARDDAIQAGEFKRQAPAKLVTF